MNLNKEFLSEIISYLISKGVTLTDVLDTFNENFNTLDANDVKREHEKRNEVRKPITDLDLMLCGRSVEESSTPCGKVDSNRDLCQKVLDTSKENPLPCRKLKSKSGQMLFDVINGKTVIEHLKENGITYTNFDNRIRKNWSVEKACTTPLTRVVQPYTRSQKSVEKAAPVIVPDSVKVVEESSPKTKMMLVDGRMTELEVSDIEKPAETLETQSNAENTVLATILAANTDTNVICLESEKITGIKTVIPAENTTKNVTIEPQTKTDTDTRVNDTNANSDAIHGDKDDYIEKALKKFVTHSEESKKDKKPKETKSDLTVLEVCQKMNMTTHELREMVNCGDFPQPDRGNKWSAKLLKEKGVIE